MTNDATGYGVVLVTVPSQQEGEMIAQALIEAKLAACVSLSAINSIYTWGGQVCNDQEWQMLIKTNLSVFPALSEKIQQLHPYEIPEIIALPIVAGSQSYLSWIGDHINS